MIAQLHLPFPTHLKIDVDGQEPQVLVGATSVLADSRLKGLMLEIRLTEEAGIVDALKEAGLTMVGRFDRRGDVQIGEICYGRFERVSVPVITLPAHQTGSVWTEATTVGARSVADVNTHLGEPGYPSKVSPDMVVDSVARTADGSETVFAHGSTR